MFDFGLLVGESPGDGYFLEMYGEFDNLLQTTFLASNHDGSPDAIGGGLEPRGIRRMTLTYVNYFQGSPNQIAAREVLFSLTSGQVPEPGTLALVCAGLSGLAVQRRAGNRGTEVSRLVRARVRRDH